MSYENFASVWKHANMFLKLFALALGVVATLSFVDAARACLALRRIRKSDPSEVASVRAVLARLERGCASRAARLQLMFYLFAAVVSWALVRCYFQIALTKIPEGLLVLDDMAVVFAFAYRCALVFVVVHIVQWITTSRVAAASRVAQSATT